MTRTLVDSSLWVELFRGNHRVGERLRAVADADGIAVCEPIVMELLAGARPNQVDRIEAFLDGFTSLPLVADVDFRQAASLRRRARARGFTVRSAMDGLIAAVAIRHGDIVLVHNDADFERIAQVSGLQQERWEV